MPLTRLDEQVVYCPSCGSRMKKRKGKYGDFYGCSTFPRCHGIVNLEDAHLHAEQKGKAVIIEHPSEYQEDYRDFVLHSDGNVVVEAGPGCGKTTTNVWIGNDLPTQFLGLAFNVHSVKAWQAKASNGVIKTSHSFGLWTCRENLGNFDVDDKYKKLHSILWPMVDAQPGKIEDKRALYGTAKTLVVLSKATLNNDIDYLAERYGIALNGDFSLVEHLVRYTLKRSREMTSLLDFDDMIWLPYVLHMKAPKFDMILGDEWQDMNRAQIELVLSALAPGGRVAVVGDRHQCQPAGTRILVVDKSGGRGNRVTFREANIEDLVSGDHVVSYSTSYGCFISSTRVANTECHLFQGRMRRLRTDNGMEHSVTPNHFCIAKWKPGMEKTYCVYLMRQGVRFRVGHSYLFNHNQAFGPVGRMLSENADCIWILKVFTSKIEARIEEQIISCCYGIPQTRFVGSDWYGGYSQDSVDSIYIQIEKATDLKARAETCLLDYHREIQYPLITKREYQKHTRGSGRSKLGRGRRYLKITAANLDPDWMLLFTVADDPDNPLSGGLGDGVCFDVEVYEEETKVYSLDIEKHHTYVANGIVTRNSLYGFRGADCGSIPNAIKRLQAIVLPLPISYRCPNAVVELAQTLVPELQAAPGAIDGVVEYIPEEQALAQVQPGDMILCRTNAPLVKPIYDLIRRGVKATIRGRDIGRGLIVFIEKFSAKSLSLTEALIKMQAYRDREVRKLIELEKGASAQNLEDKVDTVFALSEDCGTADELIEKTKLVFLENRPAVVGSSVHRAKGLEAKNVTILRPDQMPHSMAQLPWEMEQEYNCMYVAWTRAQERLTMAVPENGKALVNAI